MKTWRLLAQIGLVALVIAMVGCTGHWLTVPTAPKIVIGDVVITAGQGELLVFVADMPSAGLGGIAITLGGLGYDQNKISNILVLGDAGFDILQGDFAAGNGEIVAVNPHQGVNSGQILRLVFDAVQGTTVGDFTFDSNFFQLADGENDPIAVFDLEINSHAYHIGGLK